MINPRPWSSADGDPLQDLRNARDRLRAEAERPYEPPVYWLRVRTYDEAVFAGIISLTDPTWRTYPTLEDLA